jgi:hypothetical protein
MENTAAAKDFIQQRLREWLDLFPGLRIRYYFEPCSELHLVKFDPTSYPMDDEKFLEAQLELIFDLIEHYPEHSVTPIYEPEHDHFMREGTIEITQELSAAS